MSDKPDSTQKSMLKIIILDADATAADILRSILDGKPNIAQIKVCSQTKEANELLENEQYNSVFIDLFSIGAETSVAFVEHVRSKYSTVPICLYSTTALMTTMPGVNDYWKKRFGHYYYLQKDLKIQEFQEEAIRVAEKFSRYLQNAIARVQLRMLRAQLSDPTNSIAPPERQKIEEIAKIAEKALEPNIDRGTPPLVIVPGVNTSQFEQLVTETLNEARQSLQTTTKVNIGVLVTGSLIVVASFIVASVTKSWEAVAFGGFGMAGIIAALVTNPLKSIGASARRLVQIQVAYLSFLNQLALLNQDKQETLVNKSKQLGDEMARTLKVLQDHFGQ